MLRGRFRNFLRRPVRVDCRRFVAIVPLLLPGPSSSGVCSQQTAAVGGMGSSRVRTYSIVSAKRNRKKTKSPLSAD